MKFRCIVYSALILTGMGFGKPANTLAAPLPREGSPGYEEKNLISDYPPVNEDGSLNTVIEIPAGSNEKWQVHKKTGQLEWELENGKPRTLRYLGYPGNYGMIPGTALPKESGGDGDPLDVLVIGAQLARGRVVQAKLIGVLKFLDRGERDDKLLAVLPGTAFYSIDHIEQLEESFPGILTIIKTWFLYYKGSGKMIFQGYGSLEEAQNILRAAADDYKRPEETNLNSA